VGVAEFLDASVERVEKMFHTRDERCSVREGAEEEQALVKADEGVGIGELKARELGEKFGDEGGMAWSAAWSKAAFRGFELGEELVGIVGSGRHGGEIV
jgi:hypothetical protein